MVFFSDIRKTIFTSLLRFFFEYNSSCEEPLQVVQHPSHFNDTLCMIAMFSMNYQVGDCLMPYASTGPLLFFSATLPADKLPRQKKTFIKMVQPLTFRILEALPSWSEFFDILKLL